MGFADFASLTTEQKIGQLFFIGIPGQEIDDATAKLLRDINPGGVCLFARNIKERRRTRELLDGIREALPVEPFLSLDQEGGLVDRLRRVLTPMPAANLIRNTEDARRLARIVAESIRILGFNMDFAPVVDVVDGERAKFSNGLFSRAYGSTAEDAADLASAFLTELQDGGVVGCIKHFPGLGASEVDSHDDLPVVNIGEDQFSSVDLFPYRRILSGGERPLVMAAHAAYPQLRLQETDQNGKLLPSSLSFNLISQLLRVDLGFDGLVLTDDLEMGAIVKNYGMGEACRLAIAAGEDMLTICAGVDSIYEGFEAISRAVADGEIAEERINRSLGRIAAVKARLREPLPFDDARLEELSEAVGALNEELSQ